MKAFTRKIFIGGNWKSNNTLEESKNIVSWLNKVEFDAEKVEVLIAPPCLHIPSIKEALTNHSIFISAQNISAYGFGAYTGEISYKHLADFGIEWTLLGHSERRSLFHETSEEVAAKTKLAVENKLKVVLCVGEKLEEREAGKTFAVVEEQLNAVIALLKDKASWDSIVVAYEPVWAIGTGKVASPAQAQEVHAFTRKFLAEKLGQEVASTLRIIYGGSVNEKNSSELLQQEDIDGFLIGGASLKPAFAEIITSANNDAKGKST